MRSEAVLKAHFGWSPTSSMAARYVHLSGADVDRAILEAKGIVRKEERAKDERVTCPGCAEVNSPFADFCSKCRLALTPRGAAMLTEQRSKVAQQEWT